MVAPANPSAANTFEAASRIRSRTSPRVGRIRCGLTGDMVDSILHSIDWILVSIERWIEMTNFDLVIRGGTVFDGTGAAPTAADVGVRDGKVAAIAQGLPEGARTVDASGQWVMPGLIDVHTHYDAEVLLSPGLGESVRHGTTTVVLGNCSLSTIYSDADDCADMFARVEALPWQIVHDAVKENKTWTTPAEYVQPLETLPLGANVAAFIGHSDIRASVLGLGRSVDSGYRPTRAEIAQMQQMLSDALDAGF